MSMIEHAVGVVSLDRFVEISHMDHDEIGALLLDTMAENAKLRELVQNLRRVTPADVVGVVIGANTDHPSYYKFDKAFRELGIEVEDA